MHSKNYDAVKSTSYNLKIVISSHAVHLLFSEKGSTLAASHRPLWYAFLGRYNDISVAIRIKCVQYTMHFLINHPELQDNIVDTLKVSNFKNIMGHCRHEETL